MPGAECPVIERFKQFRRNRLVSCGSHSPDPGQQPLGGICININIAVGQRMFNGCRTGMNA